MIGHDSINKDQARLQMAVWSILAAPMMMSTDLDTIKQEYKEILLYLLVSLVLSSALALDNGLAQTPPMGWLSWIFNYCEKDCVKHPKKCLSEQLIKRIADRIAADGYKDAGYEYVIIDDCWQDKRENGQMIGNKERFKNGIRSLSDYVHSKGLKFGMYQDIGTHTCAGEPGLKGHEKVDAHTFADWQIDYLKVDGCYEKPEHMPEDYPAFGKLLNETGRHVLYSCSWPAYTNNKNYTEISKYCNIWRNYGDIFPNWGSVSGIMNWFGDQPQLADTAGPGHFHDPDMLMIGHDSINKDQARLQMAVWSILAAPMMMSTDLDTIKQEYKEILLNKDIIAVSQCKMGKMGKRILKHGPLQIWKRFYSQGIAIAILNTGMVAIKHAFSGKNMQLEDRDYKVTDLYKEDSDQILVRGGNLSVMINPTGVKFYKFVPKSSRTVR